MGKISKKADNLTNIHSNLKYYILNGVLFTIMTCLSKTYATKFLFRIGGTEFHISLYNALPGLVAVFAIIPGMILMNECKDIKSTLSKFFIASRLFTLSLAFVPLLPLKYQPIIFVVLASLMNFPEAISTTGLQSFSGDIFSPRNRSTAISLRYKFSTLAQLISLFLVGQILNYANNRFGNVIILYQLFFTIAFIAGIFEILSFLKLKEKKNIKRKEKYHLNKYFSQIINNKNFLIFISCSLLFHFGWQMGWPLFSIYQIKYLGADEGWLSILNLTSSLVMFLSFSFWNKLIRKKGSAFVMALATFGMSMTPILFALSPNLYIMTFTGIITGFFTSGTATVIFSSLLEVSPEENRSIFVGVHATLINITLFLAPLVGNLVLSHSTIYFALIVSALFRFTGSAAFIIRNKYKQSTA